MKSTTAYRTSANTIGRFIPWLTVTLGVVLARTGVASADTTATAVQDAFKDAGKMTKPVGGTLAGSGCSSGGCSYGQGAYYGQGTYYSQGSYYAQAAYYSQGSYISEGAYNTVITQDAT